MMKYAIVSALSLASAFAQAPSAAQSPDFFENKVRPVLAENCYDCHTSAEMGGLRVDSRERLLQGGKSGAAIVPGDPDKSLLIQAVRQSGDLKMPKGGKLKPAEVESLAEWVKMGAPVAGSQGGGCAEFARQGDHPGTACVLVVSAAERSSDSCGEREIVGQDKYRPFCSCQARGEGHEAGCAGRAASADPARHARPDRFASDSRRSGRIRERQIAQCIRKGCGPAAGIAALWRALGPSLAGCRALCGRRRAGAGSEGSRLHAILGRLCLSRLGDPGVQQRHAVRRFHQGATGR